MKEILYLQTLEQLKMITNPKRLAVLKTFAPLKPLSAKMIAEELGETTSKIHYHLKELLKNGILEVVETREINGIIEKLYLPTAKKISVEKDIISLTKGDSNIIIEAALDLLESSKTSLLKLSDKTGLKNNSLSMFSSVIYLTPENKEKMVEQIGELIEKYDDESKPDAKSYDLLNLIYPHISNNT